MKINLTLFIQIFNIGLSIAFLDRFFLNFLVSFVTIERRSLDRLVQEKDIARAELSSVIERREAIVRVMQQSHTLSKVNNVFDEISASNKDAISVFHSQGTTHEVKKERLSHKEIVGIAKEIVHDGL